MNELARELDYYRRQCDELGARLLRAQHEATQARRDAQRNRTLALIVQQLDGHEQGGGRTEGPEQALLMAMIERLQMDVAALLQGDGAQGPAEVVHGLGLAAGLKVQRPQGDGAWPALGLASGLWVTAPPSPWVLLLGRRQHGTGELRPVEEADASVAEAALRVYIGLQERAEALRTLRASEANYRALFDGAQDAILVLHGARARPLDANRRALALFGCSLEQLQQEPAHQWLEPADPGYWRPLWRAALAGQPQHAEARIRTAAGQVLWAELDLKRIDDGHRHLLVVVRDISARKQAEAALCRVQERLELALEGADIGLYERSLLDGEVVVDERFQRLLGSGRGQASFTREAWLAQIHPEDQSAVMRLADQVPADTGQRIEIEYRLRHPSRGWIWVLDRGKGFDPDPAGRPRRMAGTCVDITERKAHEASIHRLAFFDPLTDLPNRRLFLDRLSLAQAAAQRGGWHGAVLFIDLDNFKHINDARGHEAGDHLLQEVAARLTTLRNEDTVSRFGGDEFVVLLANLGRSETEAPGHAHGVADKLCSALAAPFSLPEGEFLLGASIGVSLFSGTGRSVIEILREADTALYRAKAAGRNCVRFFEASMQAAVVARFELEAELRQALERHQLELYLQEQVDDTGAIVGMEALLRWRHPVRGLIPPVDFIPLAEETGLIVPIGHWVLQQACSLAAELAARAHPLRVSVNVSPRQFHQGDFVNRVKAVLAETGLAASALVLEITEGLVIHDLQGTIAKMRSLKVLGLQISIDDFGTGYSSLAYLKRLPIDELKIDRSFVRDAPVDSNDGALVEAILSVSGHLGLSVVAEGVETPEQLDFLKTRGCRVYQGYLFGKPRPAGEFVHTLCRRAACAA